MDLELKDKVIIVTARRRGLIRFEPGEAQEAYQEALRHAQEEARNAYEQGAEEAGQYFNSASLKRPWPTKKA